MTKARSWDAIREVHGRLRTQRITVVARWALWSKDLGMFKQYPQGAERLFDSRADAESHRLSGSHYGYKPVKVELRFERLLREPQEGRKT